MAGGEPTRDSAKPSGHTVGASWLMAAMAGLHVLCTLSVLINLVLGSLDDLGPLEGIYPAPPANDAEALGHWGTFACIGGWSVLGLLWTPINAWGLFTRRRWARTSSLIYFAGSFVTCCCVPLGAYGLWALTRPEVKADLVR